ncbi:sugar phosphate nucleotidyltransferase [Paenibacillus sp. CF384]|uniref:sugar phosphate nucleotidyltransferase n=1 Tax=Paenibacillus sp. CF384 TaxID=1884382 RepID=UPI00089AAE6D|nr:sugar phosphate nucleotidyltransferase [Paenibacillus sp. CF384]SDX65865.1 mannose-1-phosphate guanylyltransferase (GDP) /mannose-6-phosphate isomerase, type 2 [Paenibacillus sp. CF384]
MKLILLSGGSGTRLWPLSNDARSKQFLKVLENDEQQLISMVQQLWGQLETSRLSEHSYIATSQSQVEMMQSQIGTDVPLIIEPERRDTFPAIALAAVYLYSVEEVSLSETITIVPVDPLVDNNFFETIKELEDVLNESKADLALIGVKPTYPSSKYGYIIPAVAEETLDKEYKQVLNFREKPTEAQAVELLAQQALWNCGVFSFKLGYLISLLEQLNMPIQYDELRKQYQLLPKISFDYQVVEKASSIVVVPYEGGWKDLGTWNTLTEEMRNNQIGKGTISEDCNNTHLINEIDIPVSIVGLSNIVVAASPDGILVSSKSASTRIKDYINYNQKPKYEERKWGWVRVLDDQIYEDGRCVATKRVGIRTGENLSYRMHTYREEVWTIVNGEGEFLQNGNYMHVKAGNILHIPMKTLHTLRAVKEIEMIVVQSGQSQEVNRIVELYTTWKEITDSCIKV